MAVRAALWAGVLAAALAAPVAHADYPSYKGSPVYGELQLKFGTYKPDNSAAYRNTFGDSSMTLFSLQYDRYLYQGIGSFGIGFSAGYGEKYGKATAEGDPTAVTEVPIGLHVVPLKAEALYNFDWPFLNHGIPLVPYLRGGIAYIPWWSTKGDNVEVVNGRRTEGGSFGFTATGGIAFALDFLEPRLQRDFDSGLGVNHTYLFGEFSALQASTFGSRLDLSDNFFMFGIGFEY